MEYRGRVGTTVKRRCHRIAMLVVLAGLFSAIASNNLSAAFPQPMTVDALFLLNSSHHRRRPSPSTAPQSGPSTAVSPKLVSNTKLRRRDSRIASPLIVFYGMVLDRPRYGTESKKDERREETEGTTPDEDDSFALDMIQQKQDFGKRYEHFRGRGRWGGYSLAAIPKDSEPAPLPVVSTTISTPVAAPTVTKATKQRRQRRRTKPILQITDIQQYKDEVVDATDSSLVVVRFYAPWCKACKAIESSYNRLPQEFPSDVKFVEVPLTKDNAYIHKGLGITSLPFAHVYYNEEHVNNQNIHSSTTSSSCQLVDELKINKSKFPDLKRIVRSYVDKECDVHYSFSGTGENNDGTITVAPTPQQRKARMEAHKPEFIPMQ